MRYLTDGGEALALAINAMDDSSPTFRDPYDGWQSRFAASFAVNPMFDREALGDETTLLVTIGSIGLSVDGQDDCAFEFESSLAVAILHRLQEIDEDPDNAFTSTASQQELKGLVDFSTDLFRELAAVNVEEDSPFEIDFVTPGGFVFLPDWLKHRVYFSVIGLSFKSE